MKKNIATAMVCFLFSCKKENEMIQQKTIIGSRWSAFSYKSVLDGSTVYKILYFKNDTEVEYYSAAEKTKLVGSSEVLTYSYAPPKLTVSRLVTVNNNKPFTSEGTVKDTFLTIIGTDYIKE